MTNSRATCRAGHRCEPATLREALHCQCTHATALLEALAEKEGIHPHTLAAMVNPDRDDTWLPLKRLASLLDRTKDHDAFARFAAAQVDGFFYRPPDIAGCANTELIGVISNQMTQLSEAVDAIHQALRGDGQLTVDELPAIDREIADIVEAAMQMKATAHRLARPALRRARG